MTTLHTTLTHRRTDGDVARGSGAHSPNPGGGSVPGAPPASSWPDLFGPGCNYTAIAFSALRRLPVGFRELLHQNHRWDDLVAAMLLAAVEAYRGELSPHEAYNYAQRALYKALTDMGYRRRRGGGYYSPEINIDIEEETRGQQQY